MSIGSRNAEAIAKAATTIAAAGRYAEPDASGATYDEHLRRPDLGRPRANALEASLPTDVGDDPPSMPDLVVNSPSSGTGREFLGFNRACHAVLEASILASRARRLDPEDIRAELRTHVGHHPIVPRVDHDREHRRLRARPRAHSEGDVDRPASLRDQARRAEGDAHAAVIGDATQG